MAGNDHITRFLDDLLEMKADLILQPQIENKQAQPMKMVADAPAKMTVATSRIGLLCDPENKVLARVYKSDEDACFRIFLLSSTSRSTANSMISLDKNSAFFIADKNGQVEIPYTVDIHPLKNEFQLSFPCASVEVDQMPEPDVSTTVESFSMNFDPLNSMLYVDLAPEAFPKGTFPTKLVCQVTAADPPKTTLVPIRDQGAVVHMENMDIPQGPLVLSAYK